MLSERELSAAIGSTAYDGSGHKIGTVEHFFVDDRTGAPTWVAVTTGLFGTRHSVLLIVDCLYARVAQLTYERATASIALTSHIADRTGPARRPGTPRDGGGRSGNRPRP